MITHSFRQHLPSAIFHHLPSCLRLVESWKEMGISIKSRLHSGGTIAICLQEGWPYLQHVQYLQRHNACYLLHNTLQLHPTDMSVAAGSMREWFYEKKSSYYRKRCRRSGCCRSGNIHLPHCFSPDSCNRENRVLYARSMRKRYGRDMRVFYVQWKVLWTRKGVVSECRTIT